MAEWRMGVVRTGRAVLTVPTGCYRVVVEPARGIDRSADRYRRDRYYERDRARSRYEWVSLCCRVSVERARGMPRGSDRWRCRDLPPPRRPKPTREPSVFNPHGHVKQQHTLFLPTIFGRSSKFYPFFLIALKLKMPLLVGMMNEIPVWARLAYP